MEPHDVEWYSYLAEEARSSPSSGFLSESRRKLGRPWVTDTVLHKQDGGKIVRLTTFLKLNEMRPGYRVRTLVFEFDSNNRLIAWAARPEAMLPVPSENPRTRKSSPPELSSNGV